MAATIDATVGGTAANSYVTLAEYDAWLATRSGAAATTAEGRSDDVKNRLLISATERLDQETYKGLKAASTQALKFPRDGLYDEDNNSVSSTTIPARVKRAQYKQALAMDGGDLLADTGLEGFDEVKVGPIEVSVRHARAAGELPEDVRRELRLWLTTSRSTIALVRG